MRDQLRLGVDGDERVLVADVLGEAFLVSEPRLLLGYVSPQLIDLYPLEHESAHRLVEDRRAALTKTDEKAENRVAVAARVKLGHYPASDPEVDAGRRVISSPAWLLPSPT